MKLSHTQAVFGMVAVTLHVVHRRRDHAASGAARSFEVTFWRSFFTVLSLLVILPVLPGPRGVREDPPRRLGAVAVRRSAGA